jgi:hypothetical protein
LLVESIGAFGVNGLDNFFGFSIVKELQYVIFFIQEVRLFRRFICYVLSMYYFHFSIANALVPRHREREVCDGSEVPSQQTPTSGRYGTKDNHLPFLISSYFRFLSLTGSLRLA